MHFSVVSSFPLPDVKLRLIRPLSRPFCVWFSPYKELSAQKPWALWDGKQRLESAGSIVGTFPKGNDREAKFVVVIAVGGMGRTGLHSLQLLDDKARSKEVVSSAFCRVCRGRGRCFHSFSPGVWVPERGVGGLHMLWLTIQKTLMYIWWMDVSRYDLWSYETAKHAVNRFSVRNFIGSSQHISQWEIIEVWTVRSLNYLT